MYCLKLSAMLVMAAICHETLGSVRMWAGKGCASSGGHWGKPNSFKAAVRCCSEEKPLTCKTLGCGRDDKTTNVDAAEQCAEIGRRLCTKAELKTKKCCKRGERCNADYTWSSTSKCNTKDDKKRTCVFPFNYNGKEYTGCTNVDFIGLPGKNWCGLKHDVKERSDWAECVEECQRWVIQSFFAFFL